MSALLQMLFCSLIGIKPTYRVNFILKKINKTILGKHKKKNNMDDIEAELKKFEIKDPEHEEKSLKGKVSFLNCTSITINNFLI